MPFLVTSITGDIAFCLALKIKLKASLIKLKASLIVLKAILGLISFFFSLFLALF
jgi:hypothetical protein